MTPQTKPVDVQSDGTTHKLPPLMREVGVHQMVIDNTGSMTTQAAEYTRDDSKFVKWGKCPQKLLGCSELYAVCAAAAQADCSADPSCSAFSVKRVKIYQDGQQLM